MLSSIEDTDQPWYRNRAVPHPFRLERVFPSNPNDQRPLLCVAIFPWTHRSLEQLWGGELCNTEWVSQWNFTISTWTGAIALGGRGRVIIRSLSNKQSVDAVIPLKDELEVKSVAWALRKSAPCDPLLIFAVSTSIYVVDLKTSCIIGSLRGHGRSVRSVVVHPKSPYLFCTTASDFTTRIYDLGLAPKQRPNNPSWPLLRLPSRAGPAHGLDMTQSEGEGVGQCVAVLVGNRSGGHKGDVIAAAFHPEKDLIATCGMDRAVKIWRIPWLEDQVLGRVDKPLFSSNCVHKSCVLSISWVTHDMLITHCAPVPKLVRDNGLKWEPGTLTHWRWLGHDRYFPPNVDSIGVGRCISDYRDSSSLMMVAITSLPVIRDQPGLKIPCSPHVHMFYTDSHDPLLLISRSDMNTIGMISVKDLPTPITKEFPPHDTDLVQTTRRMQLDDGDNDEDEENGRVQPAVPVYTPTWIIESGHETDDHILATAMGMEGNLIVSVGSQGTVWVWLARANSAHRLAP